MANPAEDAQQLATPRRSRQNSSKGLRTSTNSKRSTRSTSDKPVRKSSSSNNIAALGDAASSGSRTPPRTTKRVKSGSMADMKRQGSTGSLKKLSNSTKKEGSKNQLNSTWHGGANNPRVRRREPRGVSSSLNSSAHGPRSKDSRHSRRSLRGLRTTPARTQSDRLSRPSSSKAKSALGEEEDEEIIDYSEPDYALEADEKARASRHSRSRSTRGTRTPPRSQSDRLSRPSSKQAKSLLGDNDDDKSESDEDGLEEDTKTKTKAKRRDRDNNDDNSESDEEALKADTKKKSKRRGSTNKIGSLLGGLATSLGNSSSSLSFAGLNLANDTTEKKERRRRTPGRTQSESLKRPSEKDDDDDEEEEEEGSDQSNNTSKERQRRTKKRGSKLSLTSLTRSSSGGSLPNDDDKPEPSKSEGLDTDEQEEEEPKVKRRGSKFGLASLGKISSDKGLPDKSTKSDGMSDTSDCDEKVGLKRQGSSKTSTNIFLDAGTAMVGLTAGAVMAGTGTVLREGGKATGAVLGGVGKTTDFVLGGAVNATGAVLGGTATAAGAVLGGTATAAGAVLGVAGDATGALLGGARAGMGMFGLGTTKQKGEVNLLQKLDDEYEYITDDEQVLCLMMTVHEGDGLVAKDKNKYGRKVSSDPYAVVELWPKGLPPDMTNYDRSMYPTIVLGKTRTVLKNLSPVWETTLDPYNIKMGDLAEEALVRICLWDDDFGNGEDDPMGTVDIYLQPNKAMERDRRWYQVSKTSATRASGRVQASLVTIHAKQKMIVGKRKKKKVIEIKDESVVSDNSDAEEDEMETPFDFMEANSTGIGNALLAANQNKVRRNNGRVRKKSMVNIKLGATSAQVLQKGQDDQSEGRDDSSAAKENTSKQEKVKDSTTPRSRSSAGLPMVEGKDNRRRFRSHSALSLRKAAVMGKAGSTEREQRRSTSRSRVDPSAKEKQDDNTTSLSSTSSSHQRRSKREGSRSGRPSSSSRKQSEDAETTPARKSSSRGASKGERKSSGKQSSSGSRGQSQSRTSASTKKEESRSRSCSTKQNSKRSS